jgi:AraC family ethanolamine operon transcriptional activator
MRGFGQIATLQQSRYRGAHSIRDPEWPIAEMRKGGLVRATGWAVRMMESVRFDDFEACASALQSWEIEAIQLDRGPFAAELTQARSPTALVSEITFGRALHQRGEPPRGLRTVGVPADPTQRIFFRDHWADGNQLMFFPRGSEMDSVSVPGFHVFSVSYEEDRLSEISQALAGTDYTGLLAGREVVNCSPAVMQSVRHAIHNFMSSSVIHGNADEQTEFAHRDSGLDLLQAITEVLTLNEDRRSPEPARARELAVRRSLDLIDASNREPLSVVDLCRSTGVSRRTLEYAFRERFELSPKAYMLARRLDGVRAELRQNRDGQSITSVANDWGFNHLSRFAASYRRLFGELPSQTMRAGNPSR